MKMPWESFVEWMVEDFEAVHLVVGYDFGFGYKNEGNPDKLKIKMRSAWAGLGCYAKG